MGHFKGILFHKSGPLTSSIPIIIIIIIISEIIGVIRMDTRKISAKRMASTPK